MKVKLSSRIIVMIFLISAAGILSAIPIFDIQYTEDPGSGTYPSPYEDQTVTISGIITCNNCYGDKFVLSSPAGGLWNGILVYESSGYQLGDEVEISGTVAEYWGLTEIQDAYNFNLISTNNPLPQATLISTSELASSEAYEGVLVELTDVFVLSEPDEYGDYIIDDGSGACSVSEFCLSVDNYGFELVEGMQFTSIKGIVTYSYSEYHLLPRFPDDIIINYDHLSFHIPDRSINSQQDFSLPIQLFYAGTDTLFNQFYMEVIYDAGILQYNEVDLSNTLLENYQVEVENTANTLIISSSEEVEINAGGDFIKLNFFPLEEGNSPVNFLQLLINGEEFADYDNGSITYQALPGMIADEISLIQRPILSVPEIVIAGEEMEIICSAPEMTQNWQAHLNWQDIDLPLQITEAVFEPASGLWFLTTLTSEPEIYTTYDLIVSADYQEEDRAVNAVYLIPEYKDDYYFVHITDTHLPGHTFWGNDPNGTDYTEIDDLRRVIDNINLIKPEFVLFTGDVVNEGELEDFNDRHQYSLSKNLIGEFEVPVFITSGNHDIGGWDDTSPPDGTARHNWHRFFGWEYLENPAPGESYTQNYSFNYGNTLYIGMEAYINYDDYLPSIFGDSSFMNWQMNWLDDLLAVSEAESKVLFYHCDFDDEINLNSLGVDMALWGHIHSNEGSIYNYPYDLATDAVCDGRSAFRVIKVNDNELQPLSTCYAQSGISTSYNYPNSGNYPDNSAIINNPFAIDFENCQLVFIMPHAEAYEVNIGNIEYIYDNGIRNEIAVRFFLPASEEITLSVNSINTGIQPDDVPDLIDLLIYPNPFNPEITIEYSLILEDTVEISIYNLKGQKIQVIHSALESEGDHSLIWEADRNSMSSGIYFILLKSNEQSIVKKIMLMK